MIASPGFECVLARGTFEREQIECREGVGTGIPPRSITVGLRCRATLGERGCCAASAISTKLSGLVWRGRVEAVLRTGAGDNVCFEALGAIRRRALRTDRAENGSKRERRPIGGGSK